MSNTGNSIKMDAIREVAATLPLTTAYVNLGGVLTRDAFRVWVQNNTNGDVYISLGDSVDRMKFPAFTGRGFDNKTNDFFTKAGTQYQVRFSVAPAVPAGWVDVEVEYV